MMKKEFIQGLLDDVVRKRVFASFADLKEVNDSTILSSRKKLQEQPIFAIAKETGQDLEELKAMALQSFDKATSLLRSNVAEVLTCVLDPNWKPKNVKPIGHTD